MNELINSTSSFKYKVQLHDLSNKSKKDLLVLDSSILIWLIELASIKIIESKMDIKNISVGHSHNFYHINLSLEHDELIVNGKLSAINKNMLVFNILILCLGNIIYYGKHTREIVSKKIFINKIADRKDKYLGW